jgi:signal transduction histidine kinase
MTMLPFHLPWRTPETTDWIGLQPFHRIRSRLWQWMLVAVTALIYLGLGMFTYNVLELPVPQAFAIFPAVGFAVAIVAIFGGDGLLGVMLGAMVFALWLGTDVSVGLWSACRSGLEAWLFTYLLQSARVDIRLRRLKDVLGLVIMATPVPVLLNALLATIYGGLTGRTLWENLPRSFWTMLIADMVSILMLAPFLMLIGVELLGGRWPQQLSRLRQFWQLRQHGWEGLLWLVFTLFIGLRNPDTQVGQFLMESLPCLSLAWAATRFGVLTTVCASFWINSVEIFRALQNQGAFVRQATGNLSLSLLLLQTFIAVIVVMGLSLAALTEERLSLLRELQQEHKFDRVILDISHRMNNSLNVQEVMDIAVQQIYDTLKVDRVYLLQVMLDGSSCVTAEVCRGNWRSCLGHTNPANLVAKITQWYRDHGIAVTHDLARDTTLDPLTRQLCEEFQVQARVSIPVFVDGDAYGLLTVHQCQGPRHWTAPEIRFLAQAVVPLGVALHQVLLYQQERNLVVELDRQVQLRTDELQRSLLAQEMLNEGKTRLLHAVSHDLRTPIVGSLLVLRQMHKRNDERDGKMIRQLQESSERQLSLIQALLEDYRAEDATLRFQFQTIDYAELIGTTLRLLSPILTQNQAKVQVKLRPDLPPVQADPLHIQRVLENLISNALKHNPVGLTVCLDAQVVQEGAADYLRCTVADNGKGIPAEVANQLFARPYLRSTDGSSRTGMGLGLYLSHQIIIAHGGKLQVEPGDGAGVRFYFTLPIARVTAETVMQPPLQGRSAAQTAALMTEFATARDASAAT